MYKGSKSWTWTTGEYKAACLSGFAASETKSENENGALVVLCAKAYESIVRNQVAKGLWPLTGPSGEVSVKLRCAPGSRAVYEAWRAAESAATIMLVQFEM